MACMGLLNINKTIFEEYFENDTNLSNLNRWLITGANTENCISVNDVDVLCNFALTSASGSGDPFFNVTDVSNLNDDINGFSNIVKDVSGGSSAYTIKEFDDDNANYFIPNIPNALIDNIKDDHKNAIIKIFNIYQFYDYLVDNPEKIYEDNLGFNLYDFFTATANDATKINVTDITKYKTQNHYEKIITDNDSKDKLTPSVIYMCRGLYLTLLYKHIAQIYLSYYKKCDDLDGPCPSEAITSITALMDNFKTSINKLILFSTYELEVTYYNDTLTLDNPGTSAGTFFTTLNTNNHIIHNITKNNFIEIGPTPIALTSDDYSYSIADNTLASKFTDGDKCVILAKKSLYAAYSYNTTIKGLNNNNREFDSNKADYQKSITNYEIVNGSFSNIDYIYYLTFLIVIIVLVSIGATNSEQSRKTRVLIILIIVVLTYVMIFSYLEITKRLAESFTDASDKKENEIGIINEILKNTLTNLYISASNYGMTRLYDKLNAAAKNELHNVSKQNTTLSSSIDRTDATTNSEWHRLFQRTLFIHTVFMFLIVILIYLWLSTSIPNSSIYLLFITIIALMVLIFNYFRNLHRVVRSEYKHRYWTKMDV